MGHQSVHSLVLGVGRPFPLSLKFVRLAVLAVLVGVPCLVPHALAWGQELQTLVDANGDWNLSDLGSSPVALGPDHPTLSVPFALPPGAQQGPLRWYLGRLVADIETDASFVGQLAFLSLSVDGKAALQVKIDGRAEPTMVTYLTIDSGSVRLPMDARALTIDIANYLQLSAVTPGNHMLEVVLDGGSKTIPPPGVRVALKANTGLTATNRAPYRLRGSMEIDESTLVAGDEVQVVVTLTSEDEIELKDVTITFTDTSTRRQVSKPLTLEPFRGSVTKTVSLGRFTAGQHKLHASWVGDPPSAHGEQDLVLTVVEATSSTNGSTFLIVGSLFLLAGCAVLLPRRVASKGD